MSLIKEINDLRQELKTARTHVHELESALGLHRKSNQGHATETLVKITSTNKNAQLERELEEKLKVIDLQKHEIMRIRSRTELELGQILRPLSGAKLPPVEAAHYGAKGAYT